MIDIASMVDSHDSWESSSTRMTVRHKAEAEAGLASQPRALNKEIQDLLTKFQSVHGLKLEDRNIPAASTLEQTFDQVEQGELKNMSLVQFVSREDAEADVFGATIEKGTGALKVKKGYRECPKPRTPEEFRRRMSVVAHSSGPAEVPAESDSSRSTAHAFPQVLRLDAWGTCTRPQGKESGWPDSDSGIT